MSAILTVIAFSVAMLVFAYMAFKVDPDKSKINMALQIFFMFITLIMFVGLVGTVSVNNNDCQYLINTTVTTGFTTTNNYEYKCSPTVDYTPNTLLTISIAIMIIFIMYVMIGIFYYVVDKLKESGKI